MKKYTETDRLKLGEEVDEWIETYSPRLPNETQAGYKKRKRQEATTAIAARENLKPGTLQKYHQKYKKALRQKRLAYIESDTDKSLFKFIYNEVTCHGGNVSQLCKECGMARSTYYSKLKQQSKPRSSTKLKTRRRFVTKRDEAAPEPNEIFLLAALHTIFPDYHYLDLRRCINNNTGQKYTKKYIKACCDVFGLDSDIWGLNNNAGNGENNLARRLIQKFNSIHVRYGRGSRRKKAPNPNPKDYQAQKSIRFSWLSKTIAVTPYVPCDDDKHLTLILLIEIFAQNNGSAFDILCTDIQIPLKEKNWKRRPNKSALVEKNGLGYQSTKIFRENQITADNKQELTRKIYDKSGSFIKLKVRQLAGANDLYQSKIEIDDSLRKMMNSKYEYYNYFDGSVRRYSLENIQIIDSTFWLLCKKIIPCMLCNKESQQIWNGSNLDRQSLLFSEESSALVQVDILTRAIVYDGVYFAINEFLNNKLAHRAPRNWSNVVNRKIITDIDRFDSGNAAYNLLLSQYKWALKVILSFCGACPPVSIKQFLRGSGYNVDYSNTNTSELLILLQDTKYPDALKLLNLSWINYCQSSLGNLFGKKQTSVQGLLSSIVLRFIEKNCSMFLAEGDSLLEDRNLGDFLNECCREIAHYFSNRFLTNNGVPISLEEFNESIKSLSNESEPYYRLIIEDLVVLLS